MIEDPPPAPDPLSGRIAEGLGRVAFALRARAWSAAVRAKVTPTQGSILTMLRSSRSRPRLAAIAARIGVTAPTASDAVASLIAKGFVENSNGGDRRSLALALTPEGARLAEHVAEWPEFLCRAIEMLTCAERDKFLLLIVKLIRALQVNGDIDPPAMCVSCRYFRPWLHADVAAPHQCDYVDAPFGDTNLRIDCREHEPASIEAQKAKWSLWTKQAGRITTHGDV